MGWFNAQGLEAYDLIGRVMTVRYSTGYGIDDGFLLFGKSGNLIVARNDYSHALYRYDSSCNLVRQTQINPKNGNISQEIMYQYLNDRRDYERFPNGSIHYVYSTQPDGSVFVTEDSIQKMRYGEDYSYTNSKHYDRLGRLIWSSSDNYPPVGRFVLFTNELVEKSITFYQPTIRKDYGGRVTYDRGFSYEYTADGLLFRVIDRAGNVGQTRGILTFERDGFNMLKREVYRDSPGNLIDEQRNVMKETIYDNYQLDNSRNWTSRTQIYQYQKEPMIINQHRTISYW
jgi:hypothetical protein